MKTYLCCAFLALAACGSADPDPAANSVAPAESNASAPVAEAPAQSAAPVAAAILLEGKGLRLAASGPLDFGTEQAAAVAAITKALGKPPTEQGENEECGGGAMRFATWNKMLTTWFMDGRLVGWASLGGLKSEGGIGLGSGRAEVAKLDGFTVEQSTLGSEFSAGGLYGLFDSAAANAKVDALWAGDTCVFR